MLLPCVVCCRAGPGCKGVVVTGPARRELRDGHPEVFWPCHGYLTRKMSEDAPLSCNSLVLHSPQDPSVVQVCCALLYCMYCTVCRFAFCCCSTVVVAVRLGCTHTQPASRHVGMCQGGRLRWRVLLARGVCCRAGSGCKGVVAGPARRKTKASLAQLQQIQMRGCMIFDRMRT